MKKIDNLVKPLSDVIKRANHHEDYVFYMVMMDMNDNLIYERNIKLKEVSDSNMKSLKRNMDDAIEELQEKKVPGL